jgi:hypothetical protein
MSNDCIPRLPAGASHEDRNAVHSCEASSSGWLQPGDRSWTWASRLALARVGTWDDRTGHAPMIDPHGGREKVCQQRGRWTTEPSRHPRLKTEGLQIGAPPQMAKRPQQVRDVTHVMDRRLSPGTGAPVMPGSCRGPEPCGLRIMGACPELWRAVRSQPAIPLAPHRRQMRDDSTHARGDLPDPPPPPRSQHMGGPAVMMFDLSLLLNLNFLNTAPVYHPCFHFPFLYLPHLPCLFFRFFTVSGRSGNSVKLINYKRRI